MEPKKGLSAHLEALLVGPASTFLSAPGPQHPPPPLACSGAASRREPARGMVGRARGRGGRNRAAAEAAPRFSDFPAYQGCLQSLLAWNASAPHPHGSALTPTATPSTRLQGPSRLQGGFTQPVPKSHSNKMADAEKQPATSPSAQRTLSAQAQA